MRPSSQKTGIAFALLLVFNLTQFTLNRGNEIIIADNNTKKEEIQQAEIIGFCAVPANDENFFLYRLNVYTQTYIYMCDRRKFISPSAVSLCNKFSILSYTTLL